MKLNFTLTGMFLILLLGVSGLYAQQANAVVITEPAEIAGVYRAIQPDPIWGASTENVTGTATFVIDEIGSKTDGCSEIENVQGKIAFIDRGSCAFSLKALNAQNGGAIAAVICNNNANSGIQAMPGGDDAPAVTIPVFAMSLFDCAKIRIVAEGGEVENVNITFTCEPTPDPDVIWGNEPGQGDFSNGLGDWYVEKGDNSDTTWYWTTDKVVPGRYTTNSHVVEGSACNGFMVFPSDFYDNNGMYLVPGDPSSGPASGTGLCPNAGLDGNYCIGSLFSPVIDLSGEDVTGLFCRFYSDWGRYYSGSTSLIVSFDGGETWPDTTYVILGERALTLNPEVNDLSGCQVNTANVNDRGEGVFTIPIQGYTGQGSVQLQFRELGGYYHTTIDDVVLLDGGYADIEVLRAFVGRAPAAAIPAEQANAVPLHVDIFNRGNFPATNVQIMAEAIDPSGAVEWSSINADYMDQPAYCFLNENSSFSEQFTPTQQGNYRVNYQNVTAGDGNATNDTISFDFELTKSTWRSADKPAADDDGQFNQMFSGLISDTPGATGFCGFDWAMAYTFYLPKGQGKKLHSVRFGINTLASNSGDIKAYLFIWNPTTASFPDLATNPGGFQVAAADRILLGCMAQSSFGTDGNQQRMNSLLGDQTDVTILMGLADDNGDPRRDANGNFEELVLQDDTQYALVFAMNPAQDGELEFIAADAGAGNRADLSATNFALGNVGLPQRYGARTQCNLVNGGDYASELVVADFAGGVSNQPWIEMEIVDAIGEWGVVSTEEITEEAQSSIEVFPNPVSNVLLIDIDLSQSSETVSFELMNTNGQIVKRMIESNVKKARFHMDVQDVPTGIYTLNARSEAGFVSKKIVVTGQE